MEGIEVNLDTNIGKWLSKLADTVTRLAETQNISSEVVFFRIFFVFFNIYNYYFFIKECKYE